MRDEVGERRILICAPFGRDAELSAQVLQKAGMTCLICKNLTEVVHELELGADVLLTMDDVVTPSRSVELSAFIAKQPAWSDLPILVLKKVGSNDQWNKDAYVRLGNLTILESPIRPSTLVSAVRASVRARERQYEVHKADRRKDEFLAMLGHELRNPLAPIGAAAQLLEIAPADVGKVKTASQIIGRQVRHMTSLIDDLLDMARVTRGLITLDSQSIDVRNILSEAVEQVNPMLRAKNHQLQLHLPLDDAYVQGDRKRLVQVFSNILQNAAKYTSPGGTISASLNVDGADVVIEVSDNGIGMTPDVVAHAFDLFAQAERSADRSQGGLGLGLSLVESLVKSHGGRVHAHSDGLGKGSTFTIYLPHLERTHPDHLKDQSTIDADAATTSLRILLVDDNRDAADTLAMILQIHGHDVTVANNAKDALTQAPQIMPHVCLLDIGLPDMNGNDLAKSLRQLPATANAILVAVTGYGQIDDKERSKSSGFDHHFVKPIDLPQLMQLLSPATP